MPYVHVELIAGRSQAQKKALMADIFAAVVKNTGAPKEHVHVILQELQREDLTENGQYQG